MYMILQSPDNVTVAVVRTAKELEQSTWTPLVLTIWIFVLSSLKDVSFWTLLKLFTKIHTFQLKSQLEDVCHICQIVNVPSAILRTWSVTSVSATIVTTGEEKTSSALSVILAKSVWFMMSFLIIFLKLISFSSRTLNVKMMYPISSHLVAQFQPQLLLTVTLIKGRVTPLEGVLLMLFIREVVLETTNVLCVYLRTAKLVMVSSTLMELRWLESAC